MMKSNKIYIHVFRSTNSQSKLILNCFIYKTHGQNSYLNQDDFIINETFNQPRDIKNLDGFFKKISEVEHAYQSVRLNNEFVNMLIGFEKLQEFVFWMSDKEIEIELTGLSEDNKSKIIECQDPNKLDKIKAELTEKELKRLAELHEAKKSYELSNSYTQNIVTNSGKLNSIKKQTLYIHADRLSTDELIPIILEQNFSYVAFSDLCEAKSNFLKDRISALQQEGLVFNVKIINASTSAFVTAAHNHQMNENDLIYMDQTDLETFKNGFNPKLADQSFDLTMLFANPTEYVSVISQIASIMWIERKYLSLDEKNIYIKTPDESTASIAYHMLTAHQIPFSNSTNANIFTITMKEADKFFIKEERPDILKQLCIFAKQYNINPCSIYINAGRDEEITTLLETFDDNIATAFMCTVTYAPYSTTNLACISPETGHSYSYEAVEDLWKKNMRKDPMTKEVWTTKPIVNDNLMDILKEISSYVTNGLTKSPQANIVFAKTILEKIDAKLSINNKDYALKSLKDSFESFIEKAKEDCKKKPAFSLMQGRVQGRHTVVHHQPAPAAAADDDTPSSSSSFASCISQGRDANTSPSR